MNERTLTITLRPNWQSALRAAAQGKPPMAVRELARLVGRDVRRVHEDVGILSQLGLLERTDDAGVVCPYDSVHIDMHLQAA